MWCTHKKKGKKETLTPHAQCACAEHKKERAKEPDQRDQDFLTTGNGDQYSKRTSVHQDRMVFKSFCFLYSTKPQSRAAPRVFLKNCPNEQISCKKFHQSILAKRPRSDTMAAALGKPLSRSLWRACTQCFREFASELLTQQHTVSSTQVMSCIWRVRRRRLSPSSSRANFSGVDSTTARLTYLPTYLLTYFIKRVRSKADSARQTHSTVYSSVTRSKIL